MMTLFRMETFKLFKRKKSIVVIIAFVLLIVLVGYGTYRQAQNYKRNNDPDSRIAELESFIQRRQADKDKIPASIKDNPDEVKKYTSMLEQDITSMKLEIERQKAIKDNSGDWKQALKLQISDAEMRLKEIQSKGYAGTEREQTYLTEELNRYNYLLENDIKPIDEGARFDGFDFIDKLVDALGGLFLAIGIMIFVTDMVSGEASPPTMKLLLTQPVSRAKVLLSKFLSINISAVVCIIGIELIGFLVVGFIFGFGNANYPVPVGAKYQFDTSQLTDNGVYPMILVAGSSHIIPAWQHMVQLLLLQAAYIVTCTSVGFLISTLVKNSMVSMAISIVSIVASIVVFLGMGTFRSIARFVFLLFGSVGSVLNGQAALTLSDPKITLSGILIMFAVWTTVTYIIAHLVFTKKDILI